eukprot:TRINITY_DN595_c0_g1_i2.p3 TRINITY_DN595_c0_g1~~TRINITY_DN595_c0_g1_i2.p3  ORF type:complete len:217 (+),score=13.90 TRINITY_DN595_c0_g1_i2:189-839(+)
MGQLSKTTNRRSYSRNRFLLFYICLMIDNVSVAQQNQTNVQPVEILVDMRLDQVIQIESEVGRGVRGLSGCECIGWNYNNVTTYGCMNPNSYSRGAWCVVSRDTCTYEPFLGVMSTDGQDVLFNFDICECASVESCLMSYNNCPCIQNWIYRGVQMQGCGNPDGGIGGPWCPVDIDNCQHVAQVRQLKDFNGQGLGYWDYCRPGCCDRPTVSNTNP